MLLSFCFRWAEEIKALPFVVVVVCNIVCQLKDTFSHSSQYCCWCVSLRVCLRLSHRQITICTALPCLISKRV